ncbi:MAG: DUF554 domain-containing protein [Ruminococcaceae bacterium]|nr:DUF554 domain-containing protein [Oscillospiraceae bacterium]
MFGLGTIINTFAIIFGGIFGALFGRLLKERHQDTLMKTSGVSVLFISIAGVMEGMLTIQDGGIVSGQTLLIVLSLAIGSFIGEIINIEGYFERFGEWLKIKSGNAKDKGFVNAFVTASFTVSIGAMAIVGAIRDGIFGDSSILVTKSILDFVIIMVMTGSMGKGCAFSAIPVLILEGGMTLMARFIQPIMTEAAMENLSLVGSILIFCVGLNLVFGKKIRVANLLPALILAVAAAFLPFNLS